MSVSQEARSLFEEARKVAKNSTCLKSQTAALVVKDNQIVGKACNLCSPDGFQHGSPVSHCPRMGLVTGEHYDLCKSLHAEYLAIMDAGRENCLGATLYLTGHSYVCWECESAARLYGIVAIKIDPAPIYAAQQTE